VAREKRWSKVRAEASRWVNASPSPHLLRKVAIREVWPKTVSASFLVNGHRAVHDETHEVAAVQNDRFIKVWDGTAVLAPAQGGADQPDT
jgi:hypothetical protein